MVGGERVPAGKGGGLARPQPPSPGRKRVEDGGRAGVGLRGAQGGRARSRRRRAAVEDGGRAGVGLRGAQRGRARSRRRRAAVEDGGRAGVGPRGAPRGRARSRRRRAVVKDVGGGGVGLRSPRACAPPQTRRCRRRSWSRAGKSRCAGCPPPHPPKTRRGAGEDRQRVEAKRKKQSREAKPLLTMWLDRR